MTQSAHNNKQELGISELIAVLAALVALWYFFYETIIQLSPELQKIEIVIYSLVLTHGLLYCKIFFALIILYGKIRGITTDSIYEKSNQYLTNLWFPSIIFCLLSYTFASFNLNVEDWVALTIIVVVPLIIVVLFFLELHKQKFFIFVTKYDNDILLWICLVFMILLPYSLFLHKNSTKVKVVFHKEVFIDEDVTFTIERSGYIALPAITEIKLNNCYKLPMRGSKIYRIRKDSVNWNSDRNYLDIEYGTKCSKNTKTVEVPYLSK